MLLGDNYLVTLFRDIYMSLFTENDARLLDKTLVIREQIIDNLNKSELPTKARDIDAFVNLLESVDRSILAKAKVKVDDSVNKTNEETKQVLKDLLMELHSGTFTTVQSSVPEYNAPEYISGSMELNEGELIPKVDSIDVKAILSNKEE